jgi:hypothetical protein
MESPIDEFVEMAQLEDQKAVVRQLLKIRFGEMDKAMENIVDSLAEMPSNEMLRSLLTMTRDEILAFCEGLEVEGDRPSNLKDIFTVMGPIQKYYLQKEGEREALKSLAKLRFGELDEEICGAIDFLLQSPANISIQVLYTATRDEFRANLLSSMQE